MKRFEELSWKTQHKRVDDLLMKFNGETTSAISKQLDQAELSVLDADTWRGLKPRWIKFGWISG